jgi:sugar/nucleoside kinase (ribokinase family)
MSFDVFGMCNALYDLQAEVDDAVLAEIGFAKGGMFLIDEETQRGIVSKVYNHIVHSEAGGSGANTMLGVALLGGKAVYTSRVGPDDHGRLYRESLESMGVRPNLGIGAGDTGISLILITPDAQRTMLTFLGEARGLTVDDVDEAALRQSQYLYVTGYLWDTDSQKEAVLKAMRIGNEAGVKVVLSLSDPFCVDRHKHDFLELLRNHVDVVFGNREEAQRLTDCDDAHDATEALGSFCDIAAVTMEHHGSLIYTGGDMHEIPAFSVHAVDTTGAGDMYAAGLLYGLTHGYDPATSGRIGSYGAAQVVAKLGPRLDHLDLATALGNV